MWHMIWQNGGVFYSLSGGDKCCSCGILFSQKHIYADTVRVLHLQFYVFCEVYYAFMLEYSLITS